MLTCSAGGAAYTTARAAYAREWAPWQPAAGPVGAERGVLAAPGKWGAVWDAGGYSHVLLVSNPSIILGSFSRAPVQVPRGTC